MSEESQSIFNDPCYEDKKSGGTPKKPFSKRAAALILAAVAVALLSVGAYFAQKYIKPEEEYSDTGKTVFSVSADSIKSIKTEFSENTLTLQKKKGKWVCDGKSDADQNKMKKFAESCSEVTVIKKMKKNDLDYGFEKPYGTVKVSSSEGNYTVVFGSLIPDGYSRYVKIEGVGDGNVYLMLVTESEKFNKTAADMAADKSDSTD